MLTQVMQELESADLCIPGSDRYSDFRTQFVSEVQGDSFRAFKLYGVYAACVIAAAALVWLVPDLVWLNIAAQVLNVFLLPLVIAFLVALATKTLAEPIRLRGWYLGLIIGISAVVCAVGLFGGIAGWL